MGAGGKSPTALAPFARNWVGGDIHGLSAYAGTLYAHVPEMTDVAAALDGKVSEIVSAAGWQGAAASAFTRAWERDSVGITALSAMLSSAGDIVNTLAVSLATLENALEEAADTAAAHGVPIGADGAGPQACLAAPTAESWRISYQSMWNQTMLAAANARTQAAAALHRLGLAATEGGDHGLGKGDYTALFDVLAGFFGAQTRYRAYVESKLPGLKQSLSRALVDAREEARLANGRFGTWTDQGRQNFGDAKTRLASVEGDLADAQATENPFSKAWGFSPGDIPALTGKLEGLGGAGGDLARFAADVPFVDIAAAGASTYFGAQDDMAHGVPWYAAYPSEAAGNIAAVAGGGWVGGLAAGGTAAGLGALGAGGLGVSLAAGGAGVLVGGAVAYGVGDFAHNLVQENWSADISQHGVLAGLGAGTWDSLQKTGGDFVKVGSALGHGAEHLWNSIF